MGKRIRIRHMRINSFNDAAISCTYRLYAVCISLEPLLYLRRTQTRHRKYGDTLSAAIQGGVHTCKHLRTVGSGHTTVQHGFIILVARILNGTIGNEADIFRIESMVHHREDDIQIPFTPVLPHHA